MATPSASVRLKRLRQRFGISAQKVAIRTHVAWYWRALAIVMILSISLALAAWVYDAGRRIAGFHSDESTQEIQSLRNYVMELDAELTKLRSLAGSGESSLQIERATQKKLSQQVKLLELENSALKLDLAFFEGLMPASEQGGDLGLRIDQLRIEKDGSSDEYRYRMLLINNSARQMKELKGSLQLLVKVQHKGNDVMIIFPSHPEADSPHFRFEIKYFLRLEGSFLIPEGAVVKSVEARLLQDGAVRARQSVFF